MQVVESAEISSDKKKFHRVENFTQ